MEEELVAQEVDITEAILETINSLCQSLINSINSSIFSVIDDLIFIDKEIIKDNFIERIFGGSNGLLVLANSLIIAFLLYYGVKKFTSYYTGTEQESIHKFIIKGIFVCILMNNSLTICEYILEMNYNLSEVICEIGKSNLGREISFSGLINSFSNLSKNNFNIFSIDGLLVSTLSLSSFSLVIIFVVRNIMIKLLIYLSPFSFLCLFTKQTSGIFKSWLKSFISVLFVQFVVALILLFPFAIIKERGEDILSELMIIGSISVLLKSNQFVREFINGTGISTDFSSGISGIKSIISR